MSVLFVVIEAQEDEVRDGFCCPANASLGQERVFPIRFCKSTIGRSSQVDEREGERERFVDFVSVLFSMFWCGG